MTNIEIAKLLRKVAAAYTILGENRFKIIAYENAATAVEHATSELHSLWEEKKLDSVPGLGTSIIGHLDEIFRTGKSKHIYSVLAKINPAVFSFLEIPGLGPKKAEKLVEKLNIKDVHDPVATLEKAAREHKIASIETFGEKSEQDILENIERYKKGAIKERRMDLPQADFIADEIIEYISRTVGQQVSEIVKLGSLRRRVATIGDVDLAVATDEPEVVIEKFVNYPKSTGLIERGPTGASILLASGRQADLRVAKPDEFGAMLQYFTGSKYHNIKLREFALKKGYTLNEYGLKSLESLKLLKFGSEEKLYNFLDLEWIAPELREDSGEIEASFKHKLPKLVELEDIKGDLHLHSNFDLETSHDSGVNTIGEIWEAGKNMGYKFIGITNHNPSVSKHTKNQIVDKIKSFRKEIDGFKNIFAMMEVDILADGGLAVPNEGLNYLDAAIVSIHSSFGMKRGEMTERILKALSHPKAKILGHPTGRLLGSREGFEADWEKIMDFCKENNKALEINCYPNRLDLPDILVREAIKRGVLLSLGTDSHDRKDMENMKFGVSVARRGWAEAKDIINCWTCSEILKWFGGENQ